jgi:hypothetical protein
VDWSDFRVLIHGTTIHGAERVEDVASTDLDVRPEPLTYYHANSALTRIVAAVRERKAGPMRVAVVGLGTGSLACHAEAMDDWRFFEIDPAVVRVARDLRRFNYLARCAPEARIILGDARLTIADEPDSIYDLIVVDAFASDTIPVHLLTREAMRAFVSKLAPHGVVAMHISNRHLELASVVAGAANAVGLLARTSPGGDEEQADDANYKFTSTVTVVARAEEDFGSLSNWPQEMPRPGQWVWTDDYSNIAGAIIRRLRD